MFRIKNTAFTFAASFILISADQSMASAESATALPDLVFDNAVVDATGDNRPGISVRGNNLNVEIVGSSVTADGSFSPGVLLTGTNAGLVVRDSTFLTRGLFGHGISFVGSDANGSISAARISTLGDTAFALNLSNAADVVLDGVSLNTEGQFSSAINLLDGSVLEAHNSDVSTSGNTAHGLYLRGSSDGQRAVATFTDGSIQTSGDNAIAVNVNTHATANLRDTQLVTHGANAFGVWVPDPDSQLIASNLSIETDGDGAIGVFTQRGGKARVDGGQIRTRGSQAYALYTGSGSTIDGRDLSLQVGANSVGAFAVDRSQITLSHVDLSSAETAIGLAAYSGAVIEASDSTVNMAGTNARALQASNGGTLRLNNTVVSADGLNGMGVQSLASTGVTNTFDFTNTSITAANGRAITVQGGNTQIDLKDSHVSGETLLSISSRQLADGTSRASEDVLINASRSQLSGNIQADALNSRLQLDDHSSLTGAVQGLNVLTLNQSQWQMSDSSRVGQLNLSDAEVVFAANPFSTLIIDGDLTGNGTFRMNSDLASLQGDLIKVGGVIEGGHTLVVEDSGHEPAAANGQLMVVDGNGGNGRFGLYGEHVDAGAFRYTLQQQGDDWYLVNTADGSTPPEHLSKGANAAIASQTAAATLWGSQMNALVKRMGELRMGKDDGGVWSRALGSRYNIAAGSSRAFSQNNRGIEIGADKSIALPNGKVYVGGMLGTAKADLNFGEGASGNIDSRMVGAYATYMNDNGVYVDSVLKYSRLDNDLRFPTNLGRAVKGSYSANAYGADIEVGKHILLNKGWFVEPQLEITATRTEGGRYTASNGLRVESADMDSVQSRIGSLFGRSLELSNGMNAQPYVKASYVTEHAGDSHVSVNGNKLKSELPGNRMELGFGGILQVSERSKIALDAQYEKGNDIEQPWGVTLGYRYLW